MEIYNNKTIKEELIEYCNNCINDIQISEFEGYSSCVKHKWACKRLLDDFEREKNDNNFKWYWNEDEAQKVVKFFSYLRHSKGVLAGKPIILISWQRFIICQIYAWVDVYGNRRFRKSFVEVARKNAKSQMEAGICLYEISYISAKYKEINECYCAGIKRKQSKIIFNECKLMLKGSPLRNKFKIKKDEILHIKSQSFLQPLAKEDSDTGDGTNPQLTVLDELHLHRDGGFYEMHETGCKARKNPLLMCITTAGSNLNSFCYSQEYKYCSSILNPYVDIDNDRYFIDILEMDLKDELKIKNILKANPILRTYQVGLENIKDSLKDAFDKPETMKEFKTKTCNIWIQQSKDGYMDMEKWKKCEVKQIPYDLKGKAVFIGFDMSAKIDLTSIAFIIPIIDNSIAKYVCFSHSFIPNETKLKERIRSDKVRYDVWKEQKFLSLTNSEIVDQQFVMDYVIKTCKENDWTIDTLCFDPANASKLMLDLSNEGYIVEEVYQSYKSLNEAAQGFREQVYCGNVLYLYNPLLNYSMSNAIVKKNNGLIKIDKDASIKRIDPVDAMLCAFKLAMYYDCSDFINKSVEEYFKMFK